MKSSNKPSITNKQKSIFLSFFTNPFFQFVFFSLVLIFSLLIFFSQSTITIFLEKWTTIILNFLLNLLQIKTRMTGNLIMLTDGSQIKFQIIPDCTGVYPFIILASLIISFPAIFIKKIWGILFALLYTFLFNYLRLILLFVIARHSAKWFEIAHLIIWQVSFVLLIIIYFFWWIQWAKRIEKQKKLK